MQNQFFNATFFPNSCFRDEIAFGTWLLKQPSGRTGGGEMGVGSPLSGVVGALNTLRMTTAEKNFVGLPESH